MSESSHPLPILGDCRLIREVGRGEMGIVYEAEQFSMKRRVAVKIIPLPLLKNQLLVEAFREEGRLMAFLSYSNIVPAFAVGCERGVHYIAMEFIEGRSLDKFITELSKENTTRLLVELFIQAAEALEHAHQLGVVHRDIEPRNLLVDKAGKLWVIDWGLAQSWDRPPLPMAGGTWGILRFMSPELAQGDGLVDHRADIYSLGAVLYELLTLNPAVVGQDRKEILQTIGHKEPVPPRKLNRAIPPDLETIVLKAMAKEPAKRYQSALEMADAFRRFL